ncbi:hypothetical protein BC936DRAFT_147627 [Jimgerdemannia flammicorona]|uniref:RING-type domain-containing protein n=1 Tax=Jimgerdemannia flammicorona TaxID=994334 RepID=A0A433D4W6_9FUNG|nr:hypothetical protein BC936DRAFT_147627 [Jimgerdemannia flammicorona]
MFSKTITDLLKCQICLETLTDPRLLPCGHNFCARCILQLRQWHPSRRNCGNSFSVRCPNNCDLYLMTEGAIEKLPKNFSLGPIIDAINEVGICVTHDDVMGFIDLNSGKLFCLGCVSAQAYTSSSNIVSLDMADGILKGKLAEKMDRSDVMVKQLQSKKITLSELVSAADVHQRATKKEFDELFVQIQIALDIKRRQYFQALENKTKLFEVYRRIEEMSSVSQRLCGSVRRSTEVLNVQHSRNAWAQKVSFIKQLNTLQLDLERDVKVAESLVIEDTSQWKSSNDLVLDNSHLRTIRNLQEALLQLSDEKQPRNERQLSDDKQPRSEKQLSDDKQPRNEKQLSDESIIASIGYEVYIE